jgi:hypothetical protein
MEPYTGMDTIVDFQVGELPLDSLASINTTLYFTDFNLPQWLDDTLRKVDSIYTIVPPIPETTFIKVQSLENINRLWGTNALLSLEVVNDLPIDLNPFEIEVRTKDEKELVFEESIQLGGKSRFSNEITVPEIYLTKDLEVVIHIASRGSPGSVWIKRTDSLALNLLLQSVSIDSAEALFPADTFTWNFEKELGAEFKGIDLIILKEGRLSVGIRNELPFENLVTVNFPALDLKMSFPVPSNGYVEKSVDLSGKTIYLNGSAIFPVEVTSSHEEAWGWLTKEDRIGAQISMSQLVPSLVSGDSLDMEVTLEERDTTVPSSRNFSGLGFEESYLRVKIKQEAEVMGDLTLHMEAYSGGGRSEVERVIHIPKAEGSPATVDTMVDISEIFREFPYRIVFGGGLRLYGPGTIEESDRASGSMEVIIPSKLRILPDTIYTDTTKDTFTISEDDLENLKGASLYLEVRNHTPVGLSLTMRTEPPSWSGMRGLRKTIHVPPAITDERGRVIKDTTVSFTITLNEEEIALFSVKPRYTWFEMLLEASSGDTAILRTTDHIGIGAYVKFEFQIN